MKKQENEVDQVRKRIPAGRELPARFDDFLEVDFVKESELFEVWWSDLTEYELKRSAKKEAVPFLSLFDGGLVAFWYHDAVPAIVHIGSEGERKVVARDFDDFLKGINAKCCGLPDVDEEESVYRSHRVIEAGQAQDTEQIRTRRQLRGDCFRR